MHSFAPFLLSFVASTLAYSVTAPNSFTVWGNQSPQVLQWQHVDTDPSNFTVVLDNQVMSDFQPVVVAALVDGTVGSTTLSPPSAGWPTGNGFRINFVKDTDDLNEILAQSDLFNITEATTSTTSSGATNVLTASATSTPTTQSDSSDASTTSDAPAASAGASDGSDGSDGSDDSDGSDGSDSSSASGASDSSSVSGTSGTSSTSPSSLPTSGAAASYVQTGLLALFSLLGFALA
jgi:hypothetical protein